MQPDASIRWHYTVGERLESILRDRVIKPAAPLVSAAEKPVVWFSSNQDWEETVNKGAVDPFGSFTAGTKESTHRPVGWLVRIGVSPSDAPHDWNAFKRLSGISNRTAQGLYEAAKKTGARPGQWFFSFGPVPEEKWVAVEYYNGTEWQPHPEWRPVGSMASTPAVSPPVWYGGY
jgi:hypothetical protein